MYYICITIRDSCTTWSVYSESLWNNKFGIEFNYLFVCIQGTVTNWFQVEYYFRKTFACKMWSCLFTVVCSILLRNRYVNLSMAPRILRAIYTNNTIASKHKFKENMLILVQYIRSQVIIWPIYLLLELVGRFVSVAYST